MTPHDPSTLPDGVVADDLDAYLDAIAADQRPPVTDLPPDLAATAHHVQRFADRHVAPRLSPSESERIWEDLMHSPSASPPMPIAGPFSGAGSTESTSNPAVQHRAARLHLLGSGPVATAAQAPVALGGRRGRRLAQRWTRHGWPIVELLGVAALIIGLVSVMAGGLGGRNHNGGQPSSVPGVAGISTATPDAGSNEVAALPDPGQTGVMPGPELTGNPQLVWRVPIEGITGGLAVSDGTIVRAHFSDQVPTDLATTNPWTIDALSARAGTPVWSSEIQGAGVQLGGIWQGTVVLVASAENTPVSIAGQVMGQANQGYIIGLDLATGDVRWSTLLIQSTGGHPAVSSPTVTDGVAYVSTTTGELAAIDIEDGSVVWSIVVDDQVAPQPNGFSLSGISVADGVVAVYSMSSGMIYAFDAATGEQDWTLQVADSMTATPVAGGNYTLPDVPSVSTPAIADGRLYLSIGWYTGDANQSLMAIDLASGEALWTADLGSIDLSDPNRQRGVSQPYVTPDAVIVSIGGPDGNHLIAVAPDTGDQRWDQRLSDEQSSSMSIVGDTGYVAGTDGVLTGIDLQTGDERWSVETGGALHGAPYLTDGMLYQASDDGQLYALGSGSQTAATPDATPNISGLPTCDVEPRAPASDVFAMAADQTPAATLVEPVYVDSDTGQFPTAPTIAWNDLPVGSPADADVATAIQQTVDGITTCTRAGDQAQVAAYYTDDYFSRPYNLGVAEFSDRYFPSSEIPVMSGDLRVLDDGRVGMIATEGLISREIGQNEAKLYIFAEQPDGRWLIDEVVLVNNSGTAPQG